MVTILTWQDIVVDVILQDSMRLENEAFGQRQGFYNHMVNKKAKRRGMIDDLSTGTDDVWSIARSLRADKVVDILLIIRIPLVNALVNLTFATEDISASLESEVEARASRSNLVRPMHHRSQKVL